MRNLGEMIREGVVVNENIKKYLKLKRWTPAMGALLICGIKAPDRCSEIPHGGDGLDDLALHANSRRFHDARRILKEWEYYNEEDDPPLLEISPIEFFIWCYAENIETDWLRLILKIAGSVDPTVIDLTPSHFALVGASLTTEQIAFERKEIKANGIVPGKHPKVAIGRLAIRAAWEIECETGHKANAIKVVKRLQEWTKTGVEESLHSVFTSGVNWLPLRKYKPKPYDIEACEKTLSTWNKSRA